MAVENAPLFGKSTAIDVKPQGAREGEEGKDVASSFFFPLDNGGSRLMVGRRPPPETGKSKFGGEAGNKASELRDENGVSCLSRRRGAVTAYFIACGKT